LQLNDPVCFFSLLFSPFFCLSVLAFLLLKRAPLLLELHMDPQEALFVSARRGIEDDLEELISGQYKVNLNGASSDGNTALHMAAAADHTKCVFLLLKAGANIDVRNKQGETPLHRVATRGGLRTAKLLVFKGASLDALDKEKQTPRQVAQKPEVREVLTPGVDIKWEENEEDEDST
jgi:ankyrin repeat protein